MGVSASSVAVSPLPSPTQAGERPGQLGKDPSPAPEAESRMSAESSLTMFNMSQHPQGSYWGMEGPRVVTIEDYALEETLLSAGLFLDSSEL